MCVRPVSASIVFGSPEWMTTLIAVLIGFAFFSLVSAWLSGKGAPAFRFGLAGLKILAAGLLAVCLLDPQWTTERAKPGDNIVVMLADASASLNVRDSENSSRIRGELMRDVLADIESPWQTRLSQDFEVRRYRFSSTLEGIESFQSLTFDGQASNLFTSLQTVQQRFRGRPLAAVLLFTDGNVTDPASFDSLSGDIPVYPVVLDSSAPVTDLAVGNLSVTETNFEDAPITIHAEVRRIGEGIARAVATLSQVNGTTVTDLESKEIDLSVQETATVKFEAQPLQVGPVFYRLQVVPQGAESAFESPESSRESTLANNRAFAVANRDSQTHRLLYVGGRPNWEHKFLGRALEEDRLLQLVSLMRIAKKEAKFDFRGRVGERNNSLFRGFNDGADDGTENYDEPVLIRLNTRDAQELSDGFPKAKADLYQYDAVLLDDIEAQFFTRDQMSLLDRFVSERGGGLVMLGGVDAFHAGGWDATPIGDALPVYMDRTQTAEENQFGWELSREGWLEEWMRLRETEVPERERISRMPPFEIATPVNGIKPGARVLSMLTDESSGRTLPALVTQQYGRGRTAAVLVGDLWRWSLRQDDVEQQDPAKFWRQFMRWLVADVPRRVDVSVELFSLSGVPAAQLRIRVRDREFQPLEGIGVKVRVLQPDGEEVLLDAQPSLEEAGLFEAVQLSRQDGMYLATVTVPGDEQTPEERAVIGWVGAPAAREFERTDVNRDFLQRLASSTHGEVVSAGDLERFVTTLPTRKLPVMETQAHPLWHQPLLLGLVVLLLAAEWGLRRLRGLA